MKTKLISTLLAIAVMTTAIESCEKRKTDNPGPSISQAVDKSDSWTIDPSSWDAILQEVGYTVDGDNHTITWVVPQETDELMLAAIINSMKGHIITIKDNGKDVVYTAIHDVNGILSERIDHTTDGSKWAATTGKDYDKIKDWAEQEKANGHIVVVTYNETTGVYTAFSFTQEEWDNLHRM